MELNSVAPCRRAVSRNVLAENRSASTSPAPQASDPSTEYAGALIWKRGSVVSIRSAEVSSIQNGKPSPAIAYARCVCITSFARPVVPEVGISTARSSGVTPASGSRARPACSASAAGCSQSAGSSESTSITAGNGVRPRLPVLVRSLSSRAAVSTLASAASVMSSLGSTCLISPASSADVPRGFTATATAPMDVSASQATR